MGRRLHTWISAKSFRGGPYFREQYLHTYKDVIDTITYASVAESEQASPLRLEDPLMIVNGTKDPLTSDLQPHRRDAKKISVGL